MIFSKVFRFILFKLRIEVTFVLHHHFNLFLLLLATPSRQPTSPDTTSSPYPLEDIQKIIKQGFTREQAIEELKLFNGDVKKALVSLMTKSLTNSKKK